MVSDETAYRKYLAGDEAAAQLLVERYGDALTLYINGVLGDIHEAEDLMIEAFAHIFARERPIQDGCFKAYLYKTGRNLALRCKTRRRFFLPLEELPFELPDEALAETGLFQNEQHQQLYAALGKLKKEYRETLFLVYFEELSYRQAAQVLGRTEQQVTNLVYRGKQQLKQLLEQEGDISMKTDAERMALIRQRTAQLQRQARARQMLLIDAGCMAACLVLVVCLGLAMPGWAGTSVALHVSPTGTAGMLSERGADGYILVGVLSFLLGSCVTILLYRLRRSSEKKHTRDDDEL